MEKLDKVFHPVVFLGVGVGLFLVGLLATGKANNLQDMAFTGMLSSAAAAFIVGAAVLKRRK